MISRKIKILFAAYIITFFIYIVWRAFFTIPIGYGWLSLSLGIILLVCEFTTGILAGEQYRAISGNEPERPDIPADRYPHVDVFIMTHNESEELLYKTINGATYMDYPDKSKVHIYVCDDQNRPNIEVLANRMGVGYINFPNPKHAKAGNFNNAVSKTSSPLIATFDADMIPRREFLTWIVPYFFYPKMKKDENGKWIPKEEYEIDKNEKIGFVGSPQRFYNPDLFQFNMYAENRVPNEQDFFFRKVNIGRNPANAAIFAGSNTVISREALKAVGGMSTASITEDFETGMKIQGKGYRTWALSKYLAHGLSPYSLDSLLSQRERWARGCIQSIYNFKPFRPNSGLTFGAKVRYMFTYLYWWTYVARFFFIIVPILAVLFNVVVLKTDFNTLLLFWLPQLITQYVFLKTMSGKIRSQHLSSLLDTILMPYMVLPVITESLGIKQKKFVVTKKDQEKKQSANLFLVAMPHIMLFAASVLAVALCVLQMFEYRNFYMILILYWLVVNGKSVLLSVFFMMGRQKYRNTERFGVSIPVKIVYRDDIFEGNTEDISELGMSVILKHSEYLPADEDFELYTHTEQYSAKMLVTLVRALERPDGWLYSLRITHIEEKDRREYFQIVFDRPNTMADRLKKTFTVYEDFAVNINKRYKKN